MNIDLIPVGDNPPESLNVIIEVPVGGEPVKYEFDKKSGALFVDRILHTPMRYPANYGFVPHTLSPDGDPLDALVIARSPFARESGPWPKHGPHHERRMTPPTDRNTSAIDSPPRRGSGISICRPTPPDPGKIASRPFGGVGGCGGS